MRRLQQRLLAFIVPALAQSIVSRFGPSAGCIAEKSMNALLSMSAIDGDLHKNEIQDSQQLMACMRDHRMMSMDDYDRYVRLFQSRITHISALDILNWADALPVELWRYYNAHHKKLVYGQTEHQLLQQHIVFTLSGLSMASYAGLYALVSDQKVHTSELQLLNQIMGHFEKPEKLFRYVQQEPSLSTAQKNILGAEIRRYVEAFVQADLLPLTLIQHVMQTKELMSANDQTRWARLIDDITEVNTQVIDDVNFFAATKPSIAYKQAKLPLEGTVEQTRFDLVTQIDLTIDSIGLMAQMIDDEDERVEAASQLHDMTLDLKGSIAQSDQIADDEIDIEDDDVYSVNPQWRMVLQKLLEAPKVTFEIIETQLADNVNIDERIDALQYIIIQLRKHRVQVYDQDVVTNSSAIENINFQNIRQLVNDIQQHMKQSVFATYEYEFERTYLYHKLLSAGEERDLCVARDMLKAELVNANNSAKIMICELSDDIRALLINHNLRLVMRIASMNTVHIHHLELMDLFQEGCIGLIRAIDKFDITKGYRLSTYATWWIRQSIGRAIDDLDRSIRLPVHFLELIRRYRRAVLRLEREYERQPYQYEVAAKLQISLKDAEKLEFWNNRIMSLNSPIGEDTSNSIGEMIEDELDVSESIGQKMLAESIRQALQDFDERDRFIIICRFGLDGGGVRTLEELGEKLGITRERVRQIEKKTLLILRRRNQTLAEYM